MPTLPQWIVRKSAANHIASADGSVIILRGSKPSEATILLDNTKDEFTSVFTEEDEVDLYIDSVSAANHMMVGYIDDLEDLREPSRRKIIKLHITDWGSYLAGKTIFEQDYIKTKFASNVFTDSAAEIAGLSTNIVGLNTGDENMKRNFNGTYVKDGWFAAAENGGADFFVDETKTLQAFAHGTRDLDESGSGLIYKIKDIPSVSTDTLMLKHLRPYKFSRNVENRYRSVTVTNGILETYPVDIDLYQTTKYKDDERGKTFGAFYQMAADSDYDVDSTNNFPVQLMPSTNVGGGLVMPTIRVLVGNSSQNIATLLRGIELSDDGSAKLLQDIGLVPTDWQRVAFFIRNQLTGVTITSITMTLYDDASNHWQREILTHLNAGNFTYLAYDLPANLIDSPSNGWTKTGSPTIINRIGFEFTPSTGYDAKSYMEYGKLHFFRRRRATVTAGGTPATEKIIVNSTMKSINSLTTYATKEQARANVVANMGLFTIEGNQAFKKPAHNIEVDFTSTLGAGRSATVRLDELRHKLVDGKYETEVLFSPALVRS